MGFFFLTIWFQLIPNMNENIKTRKYFQKTRSIENHQIQKLSAEANKYAKLCLDETTQMFVNHSSSIRHYKKSLTTKTTTYTVKNQKFSGKLRVEVSKPSKP